MNAAAHKQDIKKGLQNKVDAEVDKNAGAPRLKSF